MMIHPFHKLFRDKKGVTAIEFALLAPILFLLTFGIVEFSLIMFTSSAIESATQIGSRLGKTGYSDPAATDPNGQVLARKAYIRKVIHDRIGRLIDFSTLTIESKVYPNLDTANGSPGDPNGNLGQGGEVVEYTVRYRWPVLTPLLKEMIGDKQGRYDIVSTALVKNEEF